MQSGISASEELHAAFNAFLSTPSDLALLVTISNETLSPLNTIPYASNPSSDNGAAFYASLPTLQEHLTPDQPLYILLRHQLDPPGLVAVTYVPDTAPVRQKMLFASTRMTLTRELGTEKFSNSMFVTEKQELTENGWKKWETSEQKGSGKPLTDEERVLQGVQEGEDQARQGGTGERKLVGGGGFSLRIGPGVKESLAGLAEGQEGNLVMLSIDIATETINFIGKETTDTSNLSSNISDSEPRYSFFKFANTYGGSESSPIIFIYTCPPGSKIKERMMYAASKSMFLNAVENEIGLKIAKKLEASSPSEITGSVVEDEFRPKQEERQAFARPKRPGKRS